MKKKIIIASIIITAILLLILLKFEYKHIQTGNNISKSDKNNILDISSYEASITVEVRSNKNTNKYKTLRVIYRELDRMREYDWKDWENRTGINLWRAAGLFFCMGSDQVKECFLSLRVLLHPEKMYCYIIIAFKE